jgi:hypothetical protein
MLNGTVTIGRLFTTVHDGEVAEAKISAALKTMSPDQEANDELVTALKFARSAIVQYKDLIEDIQL